MCVGAAAVFPGWSTGEGGPPEKASVGQKQIETATISRTVLIATNTLPQGAFGLNTGREEEFSAGALQVRHEAVAGPELVPDCAGGLRAGMLQYFQIRYIKLYLKPFLI